MDVEQACIFRFEVHWHYTRINLHVHVHVHVRARNKQMKRHEREIHQGARHKQQQCYCKFVTSVSLFCNPKSPVRSDRRTRPRFKNSGYHSGNKDRRAVVSDGHGPISVFIADCARFARGLNCKVNNFPSASNHLYTLTIIWDACLPDALAAFKGYYRASETLQEGSP